MRYTVFGKTGLQVSQLALGTGNFGTGWGHGADARESEAIFNAYTEAGGNFIDTADVYQFGQSEEILAALLAGRRENFVLATKFTRGAAPDADRLVTGNSRKAMMASVEGSLKRLKTDRIDIYWAHYPDGVTPAEEIVRGFEDLARAGKILYAGLSNFPAWRLARTVTLAELGHARAPSPPRSSSTAWSIARPRPTSFQRPRHSGLASSPGRRSAAECSQASIGGARRVAQKASAAGCFSRKIRRSARRSWTPCSPSRQSSAQAPIRWPSPGQAPTARSR